MSQPCRLTGVFLVTSSIMLFSAEPLARRGKARWGKEESALVVSAVHPARHLPGANLGAKRPFWPSCRVAALKGQAYPHNPQKIVPE
ncbi:TPA: hypothetical protein PJH04_002909 [Escherichia coli]|nr:hypothetical protein [Escherichia coli]